MQDPTDLAAQEAEAEEAEQRAKSKEQQQAEDLKWLMRNAAGRRLMWKWLEFTGVSRSTFSITSNTMAFNVGQQNVGLMLMAGATEHCPEDYLQMLLEHRTK